MMNMNSAPQQNNTPIESEVSLRTRREELFQEGIQLRGEIIRLEKKLKELENKQGAETELGETLGSLRGSKKLLNDIEEEMTAIDAKLIRLGRNLPKETNSINEIAANEDIFSGPGNGFDRFRA